MHSYGPTDYTMLLGVAVVTAATSFVLPGRWGWKAFPIVLAVLVTVLFCVELGVSATLYGLGYGFVFHANLLQIALAVVVFGLILGIRRRGQNAR